MNASWAAFAYLLVLSFELVLYMVFAVVIGRKLNASLGLEFDWILVTLPISLVLCGYSLYRFFGKLIKSDIKKAE